VLADTLLAIERAYDRFERVGFSGVSRDYLAGRVVRIDGAPGAPCGGIQADGSLLVGGSSILFGEASAVSGV